MIAARLNRSCLGRCDRSAINVRKLLAGLHSRGSSTLWRVTLSSRSVLRGYFGMCKDTVVLFNAQERLADFLCHMRVRIVLIGAKLINHRTRLAAQGR